MTADPSEARFPTTSWTQVARAGDVADTEGRAALERLCRDYWFPLYAFARRKGLTPEEAEDTVQGVFTVLLERGDLAGIDRSRGRLRSFLMAACSHFLANRRDAGKSQKRGRGRTIVSIDRSLAEDRCGNEPSHTMTPERLFDRHWALALLGCVLARLETESTAAGKAALFARLRPSLQGESPTTTYQAIADELGTTEKAVRAAAHGLRACYRELLREEVARTTGDPDDVDEEIGTLLVALAME